MHDWILLLAVAAMCLDAIATAIWIRRSRRELEEIRTLAIMAGWRNASGRFEMAQKMGSDPGGEDSANAQKSAIREAGRDREG